VSGTEDTTVDAIDLYWRPGCGFCTALIAKLERTSLPVRMHDIWADPEAAAVVRAAARGNETVPTVGVGDDFLVNPSLNAVLELVGRVAPELLDAGPT
jgi:glutaredoxin